MHSVFGLVCAFLAWTLYGVSGAVLGLFIGLLGAEIYNLKKRVVKLEKQLKKSMLSGTKDGTVPSQSSPSAPPSVEKILATSLSHTSSGSSTQAATASAEGKNETEKFKDKGVVTRDTLFVQKESLPQEPPAVQKNELTTTHAEQGDDKGSVNHHGNKAKADRLFESFSEGGERLSSALTQFFTGGNLVVKVGILVLFFGFAFLIKYAAQRNLVPIEFRLIGVFGCGFVMLGLGWRWRLARPGYALTMQGGGVGVLYLVVFAAAKLYNLLPVTLSLVVMVLLVGFSCGLAVLQNSKTLAVLSITGGFLAPLLMSTGAGNHVMLFSYYTLLNFGILGIAWFKSWRILNLVGFFFTFGIATSWGVLSYKPDLFFSTEPFLIGFFLLYGLISVLFAVKQEVNLKGYIDGPLVFGLPLVVSGLQYALVRDYPFGMAYSALGLALFYLLLTKLLWRKFDSSMRMVCEAFLALGVVFASLAIPLALDGEWSASIWALEGAGMVWVGLRQKRVLARHFGLLLQIGAALIFLASVWYPYVGVPFLNSYFLGCTLLAFAAIFSSYMYDQKQYPQKSWEKYYSFPLLIFGLLWWYIGGIREAETQFKFQMSGLVFLLFCSATSILAGIVAGRLAWSRLYYALLVQLPVMLFILSSELQRLSFSSGTHLLRGYWALGWIVALVVQVRLLHGYDRKWLEKLAFGYHLLSFALILFVVTHELAWGIGVILSAGRIWSQICWVLVPGCALLVLAKKPITKVWPVSRFPEEYRSYGASLLTVTMVGWLLWGFTQAGQPAPLKYLPLLNPLELSSLVALFAIVRWNQSCFEVIEKPLRLASRNSLNALVFLLGFLLLNSIAGRCVHYYVGIPFIMQSLYNSVIFQAAIAALWVSCALALTVIATRINNRHLWGVGAFLLGMVVIKLFVIDLSKTGTIARIISFLVVGILMLIIGYLSPIPPKQKEEDAS